MKLPVLLSLCLGLFIHQTGHAQHASLRTYTVADGLVQTEPTAIYQDNKGFLWIGTKNGISRFDGHQFQTIRDSACVSESWVQYIDNLNDSTIWFLTKRGCMMYCSGQNTTLIKSYPINGLFIGSWTRRGKGFFMSDDAGLYQLDLNGVRSLRNSLADQLKAEFGGTNFQFYPVCSKIDDGIYFRDFHGRLTVFRNNTIKHFNTGYVDRLIEGMDGRIYFFSPEFIVPQNVFDLPNYWKSFRKHNNTTVKLCCITDTTITQIAVFEHGREIIEGGHLIMNKDTMYFTSLERPFIIEYTHGKKKEYKLPFPGRNIIKLDHEGNFWLNSLLGLVKVNSFSFSYFNEDEGLCKNVQVVAEDNNHQIIVGGWSDGLMKLEDNRFSKIPMPGFPDAKMPREIYPGCGVDVNGKLFFSINPFCMLTWDGKSANTIPGLPICSSLCFYHDDFTKTLYNGTNIGLMSQNELIKGYHLLKITPGNKANRVVSIIKDTTGRLLLGGFSGLSFLEGEKVTHLPSKEFPFSAGANAMVKDPRGNIWIGNTEGLWLFDLKRFRKIQNPWFNDMIVSLCMATPSKLFIGGIHGIGFLDIELFYKKDSIVIRFFNAENGFTGNECQQNAVCLDSRGILWVATTENLQRIDPRILPVTKEGPKVYIERISRVDESMNLVPILTSSVTSGRMELTSHQNHLRFDFTAPVFRGNTFVRFRYKLEGQDIAWSQPTAERFAVYTNLAPGKYTFRVIASNSDGIWSSVPACYEIYIRPAFWQTWWFILPSVTLMAGSFFLLGFLIMNLRKKKMQKKLETEKQMAELKLISIRNQIDPHFTFNAMNSIASVILKDDKEKAYRFFVKLSTLIRQVLVSGDKITYTLAEELDFVNNYLEIEKLRFRDNFQFNLDIVQPVDLTREVPKMVVQTYAENAVKHGLLNKTDGVGELKITVSENVGKLVILIEDNGIGREQARKTDRPSTGKGMMILNFYYNFFERYNNQKILHEITDLYSDQNTPAGTRVTIIIPADFRFNLVPNEPRKTHQNRPD